MFTKKISFVFFLVLIAFTVDIKGSGDGTNNNEPLSSAVNRDRLEFRQKVENVVRDIAASIVFIQSHFQHLLPHNQIEATNLYENWRRHIIRSLGANFVQEARQVTANELIMHELDLLPHAEYLRISLGNILVFERERIRQQILLNRMGVMQPGGLAGQAQANPSGGVGVQEQANPPGGLGIQGQQLPRGSGVQGQQRPGGSGGQQRPGDQEQGTSGLQGQKRPGDQGQGGQGQKRPRNG